MDVIDGSGNAEQEMSLAEASALLERFEARLTRTYADLRARRQIDVPVFAIEHGLADPEREQLRRALSVVMLRSPGQVTITGERDPWRCWAAYGAEIGFHFCGYVGGRTYWGEFLAGLGGPDCGWGQAGRPTDEDLYKIYQRFRSVVGGPSPTSRFAIKFRIVALGISNALLPRDLQRHLVLNLARCGREIAAALRGQHPERWSVADVLRARKVETSSRFDSFLEDGPIVDAAVRLLLDPTGPARLGMSDELRVRLTSALSAQDRRHLDDARAAYTRSGARSQDRQAGSGSAAARTDGGGAGGARAPGPRVGFELEARLEEAGSWLLGLHPFGLQREDERLGGALFRVLRRHRIGTSDGRAEPVPRPADPLLQPRWRAPVRRWGSHRPIVDMRAATLTARPDPLEEEARGVIRLLGERARLPGLPILLRVARDEVARPARSLIEGETYLWVQGRHDAPPGRPWREEEAATDGVRLFILPVAEGQVDAALAALHASAALVRPGGRVQIWPAGDVVPGWRPPTDREAAHLELWLGQKFRLGLRSPVAARLKLSLVVDGEPADDVLIELSPGVVQIMQSDQLLPEGRHTLCVSAGGGEDEIEIEVTVRPRPTDHISGAWLARLLDAEPTLDDLLGGALNLAVFGPAGATVALSLDVSSSLVNPEMPAVQEDLALPISVDQVGEALRRLVARLPLGGQTGREATLRVVAEAGVVLSRVLSRADDSARRWVTYRSRWALLDDTPDASSSPSESLMLVPAEAPWRFMRARPGGWYKREGVAWDAALGALVWLRTALQTPLADAALGVDIHTAARAMRILEEGSAAVGGKDEAAAHQVRRMRHWNAGALVAALVVPSVGDGLRGAWRAADATAFEDLGPLRAQVSALVRGGQLFAAEPPWTQIARDLRPLRGAARRDRLGQQIEALLGHAPGPAHIGSLIRVATGDYGRDLGSYQRSGTIDLAELAQRVEGERWQRDAAAVVRLLVLEVHALAAMEGEAPAPGALYAGWPWRHA